MDRDEPRHPIRAAALRTGLTPATLRAWERRYGAVRPARSEGGQRLYTDQDLERLTVLRELTERGRPIRMVASLGLDEARALLREDRRAADGDDGSAGGVEVPPRPGPGVEGAPAEVYVTRALAAVGRMDAGALERTLRLAAVALGGEPFLDRVVVPLLRAVGEAWARGELTPAAEHLASGVLERVLDWLAGPPAAERGARCIVLATLPGERHGLGARLVGAAAAAEGWAVVDLGVDLPPEDIARAAIEVGADVVAVSVVTPADPDRAAAHLARLREALPDIVDLWVGGRGAGHAASDAAGVTVMHDLDQARERLRA
ncbi:MAG: MerR family transcriptional regulator [Gemmatimonadetes bacterium]|nr:MAG: MerR family transcriptional regulator [Gemmatimonadota bacterium]